VLLALLMAHVLVKFSVRVVEQELVRQKMRTFSPPVGI
jgi:hypothetical protein